MNETHTLHRQKLISMHGLSYKQNLIRLRRHLESENGAAQPAEPHQVDLKRAVKSICRQATSRATSRGNCKHVQVHRTHRELLDGLTGLASMLK
jgi:hypothetical protein